MELLIVGIIIVVLVTSYRVIIYKNSGYKEKSQRGYFKTYYNKGNKGEFDLFRKLTPIFGLDNVFVNVYLKMNNGKYTEIDMIAIGDTKIYIFEMKNYTGRIYGSVNGSNWTQTFHKNAKYKFYNPIKQNRTHVNAVKRYLNIKDDLIKGIIVFGNKADLSYLKAGIEDGVYQLRELPRRIKIEDRIYVDKIPDEVKSAFQLKFFLVKNASEQIKQEHLDYVKQKREN